MPEAPAGRPATEATTDAVAGDAFLHRTASLLGEQSADIADRLDRWCDTLGTRLQQLHRLAERGGPSPAAPTQAAPAEAGPSPPLLPPPRAPSSIAPELRELRAWPVAETWQGWESWEGGDLRPGGMVRPGAQTGRSGAVTRPYPLASGGLYRVSIARTAHVDTPARLHILDSGDAPVAADRPLPSGMSEHFIFVSHRLRTLRLAIAPTHPEAAADIVAVTLAAVDIETFQQSRAHLSPAPIVAMVTARQAGSDAAHGLRDAVESLLLQCDAVRVTLNGAGEIPGFLRRPRVTCRVRHEGDALPDETAFGWLEEADARRFLVLAAGDAAVPPEFCTTLLTCLARRGYRAVAGLHGFLLQQPILPGRAPAMVPLTPAVAPSGERTVHLLRGTMMLHGGCLDLHAPLLAERTLAEAALAVAAQQARVPMLSVPLAHPRQGSADTEAGWTGDDPALPASLLVRAQPVTLQPSGRAKAGLLIVATSPDGPADAMHAWRPHLHPDIDWVFLHATVAATGPSRRARLAYEVHLIDPAADGTAALGPALDRAAALGLDLLCIVTDTVRVRDAGFLASLAERCRGGETLHLFLAPGSATAAQRAGPPVAPPPANPQAEPMRTGPQGRLMRASPQGALLLAAISGASLLHPQRFASAAAPADPPPATDLAELVAASVNDTTVALFHLPSRPAGDTAPPAPALPLLAAELFERVVVLNSDDRHAHWRQQRATLAEAGIAAERARMIDPAWPEVVADYIAYRRRKLPPVRDSGAVQSDRDLHLGAASQAARMAYVAHRDARPPIGTAADWALLASWERVLTRAIREGVTSLLILADTATPDPRAAALLAAAAAQLPDDWLCLLLGTTESWTPTPAARHARLLWRLGGLPAGSFAVGLRGDALPFLIARIRRRDLPLEEGALSALTRSFPQRCFAMRPAAMFNAPTAAPAR